MKTIIATVVLFLVASMASAMGSSHNNASAQRLLDRYGFDVSVAELTDFQVLALEQVNTSTHEVDGAIKAQIKSILNK